MKVLIKSKWILETQMKEKEIDLSKEMLKHLDENNIKYEVSEKPKKNEDNKV